MSRLQVDSYAYRSRINQWNQSFKLIFGVTTLVAVIALNQPVVSIATLCYMTFLTVGVGKISFFEYARLLLLPITFILMSSIAIAFEIGTGEPSLWEIRINHFSLSITKEGIIAAATISLKALAAISALFMITLSTPMSEVISVLRKAKVPVLLLELMHLIYRYLFILLDINQKQREATRSRLGYIDRKTAFRTFGCELANLFVLSMKKANLSYDAMEARGDEGECLFWEEKHVITRSQLIYALIYTIILLLIMLPWRMGM